MAKEVVFILDRSGSMQGLEADTIGGFNGLIEQQKALRGKVYVTTVLFDDAYETLDDYTPLDAIEPLDHSQYYVRGTTALLDAVGKTITRVAGRERGQKRRNNVLVVIMTDGLENASQEYSYPAVKSLIDTYQRELGWEFLFLGANIDAVKAGRNMGIRPDRSAHFHADRDGVKTNFKGVNRAVHEFRSEASMSHAWREDIDADYRSRKKKK